MTKTITFIKEIGKITGHILLGLAVMVAAIFVSKTAVLPMVLTFVDLTEAQVYNVSGLANIILTGVFYYGFVRIAEKRRVPELAFKSRALIYGTIGGAATIGLPVLLLFAVGYYQVVLSQGMGGMAFVVFGIGAVAIGEEFIFRGILFRILEKQIGTLYGVLFVCGLFGAGTIFAGDELSLMAVLASTLTSVLWCGIYIWSRNIWVVALHHLAWNYTEFASGLLDEHWRISAPVVSSAEGPVLFTGGTFGPEASVLTLLLCSVSILFIYSKLRTLPTRVSDKIAGQHIVNPPAG